LSKPNMGLEGPLGVDRRLVGCRRGGFDLGSVDAPDLGASGNGGDRTLGPRDHGRGQRLGLLRLEDRGDLDAARRLGGLALLLDLDLFFPRALEVFRGALGLTERLAKRLAELGQLARTEEDQRDDEDEYELGKAKVPKH